MLSTSGADASIGTAPLQQAANFEDLLDAAPDAMLGMDRNGVIRFVNRETQSLFGYVRGDLVGQPIETLVPESLRPAHEAHRAGYVADPKARVMETDLVRSGRRRDGSQFPVEISLSHLGVGEEMLVIAAVHDMTSRAAAEAGRRQSDRMLAVVEFNADAIFCGTADGMITSWNPAAERLFGYTANEIIGKSSTLLSPRDRVEPGPALKELISSHFRENFETNLVRRDGSIFAVSLTVSPICDEGGVVVGTSAIARDVTEQKRAFEAAQRMAAIVEFSGEAILTCTRNGIITSFNPAASTMFRYGKDEIIGKSVSLLSPASVVEQSREIVAKILAGQPTENLETVRIRSDGSAFPVSLTASAICDKGGAVVGMCAIVRDLTEQHHAAKNARNLVAAEELVRTVMASASVGIALTDMDRSFTFVNRSLCDLLGHDQAWFLTRRVDDIVHPDDIEALVQRQARGFAGAHATQLRFVRADGATVWVRLVAVLVPGGDRQLVLVQVEDITAEHDAQEALAYQAFHDPMTGLHNRAWVMDILKADLRAAKVVGASVGTLFVDLDKFNVVNDSLGHEAGDEVLATVAERIVAVLGPGDRVGRFGGDSFVIVVRNVDDILEVERLAGRVSDSIAADLQVRGHRIVPTASIGIALSTLTSTPESMLRDTDAALYRAKTTGRGRWQFFDDAMHAQAVARLTVEDELRHAITRGEFVVYYQPIVTLADAHVVGHEALVRWAHPTRGLLSPGDFVEVAEDSGLITKIGAEVLDQTCALLASRPELPPISVNVSAVQLGAPDWLGTVTDTLAAHRVDPARLVIEVTETAALSLTDSAVNALVSLSGLGVGIHLDDFGTGYSSISVLRDLPVTGVKLDLRFVHDLTTGPSQANALAQGLSGLVKGMDLTGIAEGIETVTQAHILRAQGWECGQGYYFGRPAATPVTSVVIDHDLIA